MWLKIEYEGLALECEFDYQPAEKATKTCPSCHATIEGIYSVLMNGTDIIDMLNSNALEEIKNELLKQCEL